MSQETIQRMIQVFKSVKKDDLLYAHCRAGRGRTSAFVIMYDVYNNANNVSFDDIMYRNYWFSDNNMINKTPEEKQETVKVFRKFYDDMRAGRIKK